MHAPMAHGQVEQILVSISRCLGSQSIIYWFDVGIGSCVTWSNVPFYNHTQAIKPLTSLHKIGPNFIRF